VLLLFIDSLERLMPGEMSTMKVSFHPLLVVLFPDKLIRA
jgi:hypothetical protein